VSQGKNGQNGPSLLVPTEAAGNCPRCESIYRREFVFCGIHQDRDRPIRIIEAYCDHCEAIYMEVQSLRGGEWFGGRVEPVTDPKRRQRILNRVAKLRGDIQLAAC
jgi:hypothetical protein